MLLSVVPLLLMALLALVLQHFYWDAAVQGMASWLDDSTLLASMLSWLASWGVLNVMDWLAPLMVVLLASPVLVVVSLLAVAFLMTPALVNMVAVRRFPSLERKQGGALLASISWSLGSTVMALLALLFSVPLWLVPPLVLVLPPLIWGWLTYRVMAFDALAEHASKDERREVLRRHRVTLLGMGVLTGYLGAAPSIVWASGVVFAAAFVVLLPLAIWIYTLVFAFSSLWFAHFCLQALAQLRAANSAVGAAAPVRVANGAAVPGAPGQAQPPPSPHQLD